MLLGTLSPSLLENLLTGSNSIASSQGWDAIRAGEGTFRTGKGTATGGENF